MHILRTVFSISTVVICIGCQALTKHDYTHLDEDGPQDTGSNSESNATTDNETDSGRISEHSDTHTLTSTDADSENDTESGTITDTWTDTVAGTETASGPDTDTLPDTVSGTDTAVNTDTTTTADTDIPVDTAAVTDTGSESEHVVDSATETNTDTGTVADTATETDTGTVADTATETDTGTVADTATETDSGTVADTATETDTDTGTDNDTNAVVSAQILSALDAANSVVDIPITGAIISYIKPAIGSDAAGFFIQNEPTGPALFVAVDTQSFGQVPTVGDKVDFTITQMATLGQVRMVQSISDFAIVSSDHNLDTLTQDVSGAYDVVSAAAGYISELVDVQVSVVSDWVSAGSGFLAAKVETAGVAGDTNLEIRWPEDLVAATGVGNGCTVDIYQTPLWRYNERIQFQAFDTPEVDAFNCPAPMVQSATAQDSTTVQVVFSAAIDPASILSDGSQFSLDGGLMATAAVVSGNVVTLVTTQQTQLQVYNVVVSPSVTDLFGTAVDALNDSTAFPGFMPEAVAVVNEIAAEAEFGCDLIELRVVSGGTMRNIELWQRAMVFEDFGDLYVQTDDLILVHLLGSDRDHCNPNFHENELVSKDEISESTYGDVYDNAWDIWVWEATGGITSTDTVVMLRFPDLSVMDAVLLADDPIGTTAGASETYAQLAADAGEWTEEDGSVPLWGFVDDDFCAHAVLDLDTSDTNQSIQRNANTDTNTKADWSHVAATWGQLNEGQSAL